MGRFDERMIGVGPFFVRHCRPARLYQRRDVAGSQQSVGFRELGVHAVAPCKAVHCSGATDDLAASDKAVRITNTMATPGSACPLRCRIAIPLASWHTGRRTLAIADREHLFQEGCGVSQGVATFVVRPGRSHFEHPACLCCAMPHHAAGVRSARIALAGRIT